MSAVGRHAMLSSNIMISSAAIMQPYFLPYIGYWQLIHACDDFVLYDDVNYIKRGWINRNNFLINGEICKLTLPCRGVSQNRLISEISLDRESRLFRKFFATIEAGYRNAPQYSAVMALLSEIQHFPGDNLADFLHHSIVSVCNYIGLNREIHRSSVSYAETRGLGRAERLGVITGMLQHSCYINAPGGDSLYQQEDFDEAGVSLRFLRPKLMEYPQQSDEFQPGLSIVDLLMNCSVEAVSEHLSNYTLD